MHQLPLLFLLLVSSALACPYYSISPYTNYTFFSQGSTACSSSGKVLHVCNGATINATEVVPAFSVNLAVVGDINTDGSYAVLTILSTSAFAVFRVSNSADVSFSTIQIAFNYSLFVITNNAALTLSNTNLWFGQVGVTVQTGGAASTPGIGFFGNSVLFGDLGIALYSYTGPSTCTGCYFLNSRTSAVSVGSQTIVPYLYITYSVWFYYTTYVNIQTSLSSPPFVATLPTNWGLINNNFQCQFCYVPTPSQSATQSLPFNGGGTAQGSKDESAKTHPWQIAYIVVLAIIFVIVIGIMIQSRSQQKFYTLKEHKTSN